MAVDVAGEPLTASELSRDDFQARQPDSPPVANPVATVTLVASTSGVFLSAGFVVLTSSISLGLLGLLTARPVVMRGFDPVEVLFAWEKEKSRRSEGSGESGDEETLQSLVK